MNRGKMRAATAFFVGFLTGFLTLFFLFFCLNLTYELLHYQSLPSLWKNIEANVDRYILLIIAYSFAFSVVSVFSLKGVLKEKDAREPILHAVVFFLITYSLMLLWFFFRLNARIPLDGLPRIFVTGALFALFALFSIAIIPSVRKVFFILYAVFLKVLMIEEPHDFLPESEKTHIESGVPEYEIFLRELESNISINRRYKRTIGILGFKITNQLDLMRAYSDKGYDYLEKQVITLIKSNARVGEDQCLVQKGAIFSLIFANEEEAFGAIQRYANLLHEHRFCYREQEIAINIVMGVAGFDFSKRAYQESVTELRDAFMWKIFDVLSAAEDEENAYLVQYN